MIRIKICGITNQKDALKAASLGAWALGFVFYKKSPRFVGPFKAQKIIQALPPFITPVGVFVDQKEGAVKDIAHFCGIKTLQFHGDESASYCKRFKNFKVIKAIRVDKEVRASALKAFNVDAFLFDTFKKDVQGGTGEVFDWGLIKSAKNIGLPIILSGGLCSQNVQEAIEAIRPYAVDVSSGVEQSPGMKNERLMKEFFGVVCF